MGHGESEGRRERSKGKGVVSGGAEKSNGDAGEARRLACPFEDESEQANGDEGGSRRGQAGFSVFNFVEPGGVHAPAPESEREA